MYKLIPTFLFLMIAFSSCKIYSVPKRIVVDTYIKDGELKTEFPPFDGIRSTLDHMQDSTTLNIFLVHGMRNKHISEFDNMVRDIAKLSGLTRLDTLEFSLGVNIDFDPGLKVFVYEDSESEKKVHFNYIHWSPATRKYKKGLEKADDVEHRAKRNKEWKDGIVNDGFSDVTALANSSVRLQVFRAFEIAFLLPFAVNSQDYMSLKDESIAIDVSQLDYGISNSLLISGSLGSKLTYEFLANYVSFLERDLKTLQKLNEVTLYGQKSETQNLTLYGFSDLDTELLASRLKNIKYNWYLLSNQLRLLDGIKFDFKDLPISEFYLQQPELMRIDSSEQTPTLPQEYEMEILMQKQDSTAIEYRRLLNDNIDIISFYDPNDFLGFRIPPRNYDNDIYANEVYNISIPIQGSEIVGIANPLKAHVGAKSNPFVQYIIANGWDGQEKLPRRLRIYSQLKE